MIVFVFACLVHSLPTLEAFSPTKVCYVGDKSGFCMPKDDCYFKKCEISKCGNDVCCLDSVISERKCKDVKYNFEGFDCRKGSNMMYKIIGGNKTSVGEFPHMVAIGKEPETPSDHKWFCGGSIVSELFVLTAAHCLQKRYARNYMILAGATKLDDPTAQVRYGAEVILHHKYRPWNVAYDVALIKVDKPFQMSANVFPICLLEEEVTARLSKGVATGFGVQDEGSEKSSGDLMKVTLQLFSTQNCLQLYPAMARYGGNKPSMMCAGDPKGGKDTCQGDSGGPFAIPLNSPPCHYGLVGITSTGASCGFANSPGIYIKVSYFLSWIEKYVWHEEMEGELSNDKWKFYC